MWSAFVAYFELGFRHIADVQAHDHILFVVALSAGYALSHWRELLVLVTAFTVGHSVTLALATLRLVTISTTLVEILIPATIVVTGVYNILEIRSEDDAGEPPARARHVKYAMALVFGLIHGLGFSTFLRAALGEEESIALPLFSFNVGLEVGQVLILSAILILTFAVVQHVRLPANRWALALSGMTAVVALAMLAGRLTEVG